MIRLALVLSLVITTMVSCAQPPITRSTSSVTAVDAHLRTSMSFGLAIYSDTSAFNGLDSLGSMMYVKSQGVYYRDTVATGGHKWVLLLTTADQYWQLTSTSLSPISTSYGLVIGASSSSFPFDVLNGTGRLYFDGTRMVVYDASARNNILVGTGTGTLLNAYTDNIGMGASALRYTQGNFNTGIGRTTLYNTTGDNNTAIGYQALNLTDSSNNTAIGFNAGLANYGENDVVLGSGSGNYTVMDSSVYTTTEIVTGTTTVSGTNTAAFITANSLSIGEKYPFSLRFNGTIPSPYSTNNPYLQGTVTASNTIEFSNVSNFTTQGSGTMSVILYSKQDNAIAIGFGVFSTASNEIAIGNSDNDILRMNQFVVDLTTVPTLGYVLAWDGNKWTPTVNGGGGGGNTFVSPLVNTAGTVTINSATTSTPGVVTPNANDFNLSGSAMTIDYVNGQLSTNGQNGFLSAADHTTFAAKQAAITGALTPYLTVNASANRVFVSDGSGKMTTSATTSTEVGYVSGVTSAIQTQLNGKLTNTLNSAQIFVGNGSNVATGVTMSGAATLSNAGVLTLATSGVVPGTYSNAVVTVNAFGIVTNAADGSGGGGGTGTVIVVTGTSPISITGTASVSPNVTIANAAADGTTLGAMAGAAADFNATSGVFSIDWTNTQKANTVQPGALSSTDWNTFNNKLTSTLTNGNILVGNGSNVATSVTMSGNATLSNAGVLTIANDAVTFAKMQNIASGVLLGRSTAATGDIETISIGSGLSLSGGVLTATGGGGSGTVTSAGISMPVGFTISGSPVTTSGTLTVSTTLNGLLFGNGSNTIAAATITSPLTYSAGTLAIQVANTSQGGYLTSTDWNVFNNKQATITGAATTVISSNLTASMALISNASGKIDVHPTATTTDLTNLVLQYQAQALTDAATITMNCANGYVGTVTLGGSRNITFSNVTAWHTIRIVVTQDATGGRTLTFPANTYIPVGFGTGTTLNLTTIGAGYDIVYVDWTGSRYNVTIAKNFIH